MTSIAQRRANRTNALKSTGPKTKAGKRRASLNAVSHGLSAPADPAWREGNVSAIQSALQGERLPDADVRHVAETIFEFERNICKTVVRSFGERLKVQHTDPIASASSSNSPFILTFAASSGSAASCNCARAVASCLAVFP